MEIETHYRLIFVLKKDLMSEKIQGLRDNTDISKLTFKLMCSSVLSLAWVGFKRE